MFIIDKMPIESLSDIGFTIQPFKDYSSLKYKEVNIDIPAYSYINDFAVNNGKVYYAITYYVGINAYHIDEHTYTSKIMEYDIKENQYRVLYEAENGLEYLYFTINDNNIIWGEDISSIRSKDLVTKYVEKEGGSVITVYDANGNKIYEFEVEKVVTSAECNNKMCVWTYDDEETGNKEITIYDLSTHKKYVYTADYTCSFALKDNHIIMDNGLNVETYTLGDDKLKCMARGIAGDDIFFNATDDGVVSFKGMNTGMPCKTYDSTDKIYYIE